MGIVDTVYRRLVSEVVHEGDRITTRNATVLRITARTEVFASTPLISVRKTAWKNALREMEWFLSGSNNINDLHPSVRHWWEPWADKAGVVWANYGQQFRHFADDFDQIQYLIDGIREHPFSRRNAITTWHTRDMADPATPITNCHSSYTQAFVDNDNMLDLVTYQRSADVICGLPHNWMQYWAFLLWLSRRCGRQAGMLTWIGGDVHVYEAHLSIARELLATDADVFTETPQLVYAPTSEDFRADDFSLDGEYKPVITTKAEMIV